MGRLSRINSIVNDSINPYAHVKIMPRGLPYFQDSLLRGTIRFGKRTGNSIAVVNPDNTQKFGAIANAEDTQITMALPSAWFDVGAILSIGPGQEFNQVLDITDSQQITLERPLGSSYDTTQFIQLWAFPLVVQSGGTIGDTQITVRSHYPLGNGDVFCYLQSDGLLESLFEIRANTAVFTGDVNGGDEYFTQVYNLKLDKPLTRNLAQNLQVYHRAYPAYFSQAINVPNSINSPAPIGPFLFDLLGGRIVEGQNFEETIGLRTLNSTGGYVLGDASEYVTVDKNYPVMQRPLTYDFPLFWELAEGTMKFTPSRTVMIVNQDVDRLFFCAGTRCIPSLNADGTAWRFTLTATDACTIRFIFNPYTATEFTLPANVAQTVLLTMPTGTDPITSLEINILGNSTICQVQMSDWTPATNTVQQLQYSLVVEAVGIATYQSTGAVIKPIFLSTDLLKATYDQSDSNYDGGKVYF